MNPPANVQPIIIHRCRGHWYTGLLIGNLTMVSRYMLSRNVHYWYPVQLCIWCLNKRLSTIALMYLCPIIFKFSLTSLGSLWTVRTSPLEIAFTWEKKTYVQKLWTILNTRDFGITFVFQNNICFVAIYLIILDAVVGHPVRTHITTI